MIAKILIHNVDRAVLLLFINFKQKLKVLIKDITKFILNVSNLCERLLEDFSPLI